MRFHSGSRMTDSSADWRINTQVLYTWNEMKFVMLRIKKRSLNWISTSWWINSLWEQLITARNWNWKLSKLTNLTSLKSLAKMITNQAQLQTSKSNSNQNSDQDTTDSRIRTRSVTTAIIQIMMNSSATIRTESANQRNDKRFTNLSLNILFFISSFEMHLTLS